MKEKIIQFGEGNFLRGFVDYFIDLLNKKGLFDGGVVVVQPRRGGKVQLLNEQGCKYNLFMRGVENGKEKSEHVLVESISRGIDPYENFDEYITLADNPDFRFVVSNTTEAGIAFDESCRFDDKPCLSFPGKLTQLLFRRYQNGLGGFVFLPCELIDANGDALKSCVLQYAALWGLGGGFADWVNEKNTFCNTLVDRIVTGFPADEAESLCPGDKLLDTAEVFHLWVIQGNYENELPLVGAGLNVIWADDVKPYKKRKVRILNGAHTSMVAGALLCGVETVGECMGDETVFGFLNKCMFSEILPTIGFDNGNEAFALAVYDRFRNPFIRHRLRSIALNSVSKFSVRVLPTLLEYKQQRGVCPKCLTMSLALLLEFYKTDTPDDLPEVTERMKNGSVAQLLSDTSLWQADLSELTQAVEADCEKIKTLGARGAMEWAAT